MQTRLTNVTLRNGRESDTLNSVQFNCLIVFILSDVIPVSVKFVFIYCV